MIDYRKTLELKGRGLSINSIAGLLGCKWDTVQRALCRMENVWGDLEAVPPDLTSLQIADMVLSKTRFSVDDGFLQPDCEIILDRQRKGLRRNDLWTEYVSEAASRGMKAYKITRFNEIVTDYQTSHDISYSVSHEPGVEGQVDWCGDKGMFVDPRSGEVTEVSVFVCTLPYSGYFYAEGFLDMTMQNWITGHRDALDFFEGTPLVLSPDNCATAVDIKKQWWDDAILNTQYCAFADHFCITLKPARPLAPRDKGAVERSVGVVEADIIPEMNRIDIYSLEEFNRILWKKMSTRLEKRYSKKSFSRKDIFISEEKQTLQPLPACEFELYAQKTAVVGRDFHIQYDSAFYSVPVDFIKSKVTVRATSTKVRIYDGKMVLIAEHSRATHKWQRCTDPSHIPEGHAPTIAYSRDAFINKASGYGDELVEWVESVLGRFEFEVQGYRPVNAVLCSISRFHPESVLKAARLARKAGVYSSKGFLTCCRQFEAKLGSGNEEEVQPSLDDLFCSHSASKEGAR